MYTFLLAAAGGEIGGTSARDLARFGATLALIDIHEQRLQEVVSSLKKQGVSSKKVSTSEHTPLPCDIILDSTSRYNFQLALTSYITIRTHISYLKCITIDTTLFTSTAPNHMWYLQNNECGSYLAQANYHCPLWWSLGPLFSMVCAGLGSTLPLFSQPITTKTIFIITSLNSSIILFYIYPSITFKLSSITCSVCFFKCVVNMLGFLRNKC